MSRKTGRRYSRGQVKRLTTDAEKMATRRAIEKQYAKSPERPDGLSPGDLDPPKMVRA